VFTACAPVDGRNYRPKHVELIEIINKSIIFASSWLFYYCMNDALSHKYKKRNKGFSLSEIFLLQKGKVLKGKKVSLREERKIPRVTLLVSPNGR